MRGGRSRVWFGSFLAAICLAAAVAGCGGGGSSSSASANGAATANPVSDSQEAQGTLGWSSYAPSTWDPVTSYLGGDMYDLSLVYASLTRIGPEGEPEPALASKWEFSKDGLTFNIFVRKELKFTDGTPVDAQAVKTNLLRGEHDKESLLIPYLEDIKSVKVVNPDEVSLALASPDYVLPLVLGGKAGMMVSPKAIKEDSKGLATQPVGAGPFELTEYVAPATATLVRNPGYWDAKDIHLEGVHLKFFSDENALLSSLLSGQVQLASISGEQVKTAESAGFKVEEYPSLHVADILVNSKLKPLENHLLVEAVNYAIDRKVLLGSLAGGHGEVDDEIFPPGYSAYNESVADYYTYDPGKAKELLKQANYDGSPITITWFATPGLNLQSEGEQLQAQLESVGIAVTLNSIPAAQAEEEIFVKHSIAFTPNEMIGREAPSQMLETAYGEGGQLNPGGDASPEFSAALSEIAKHPIGSPAYDTGLQEATKLATEQGSDIMLFTQPFLLAHSDAVTGLSSWIQTPRLEGVQLSE